MSKGYWGWRGFGRKGVHLHKEERRNNKNYLYWHRVEQIGKEEEGFPILVD